LTPLLFLRVIEWISSQRTLDAFPINDALRGSRHHVFRPFCRAEFSSRRLSRHDRRHRSAPANATGNDRDLVIAPGGTGAETIAANSAAGGNSSHRVRAVPNGRGNPDDGG
jgi:hypothetical protein